MGVWLVLAEFHSVERWLAPENDLLLGCRWCRLVRSVFLPVLLALATQELQGARDTTPVCAEVIRSWPARHGVGPGGTLLLRVDPPVRTIAPVRGGTPACPA